MRIWLLAIFASIAGLMAAKQTDAHWIVRHFHHLPHHRVLVVPGEKKNNAADPARSGDFKGPANPADTKGGDKPAQLNDDPGLQAEIRKRIAYWQASGTTPEVVVPPAGKTATVTVKVGDQTIEIQVRVVDAGGGKTPPPQPTGNLAADIQAAYTKDTIPGPPAKEKEKARLQGVYSTLAKKIRANDMIIQEGQKPFRDLQNIEDVEGFRQALLLANFNPKYLVNTQAVIDAHLNQFSLKKNMNPLTPAFRNQMTGEFDNIASALGNAK